MFGDAETLVTTLPCSNGKSSFSPLAALSQSATCLGMSTIVIHHPLAPSEAGELLAYTPCSLPGGETTCGKAKDEWYILAFCCTADTVSVFFARIPVQIPGGDVIRRTREIGWTSPSRRDHRTTNANVLHEDAYCREHTALAHTVKVNCLFATSCAS